MSQALIISWKSYVDSVRIVSDHSILCFYIVFVRTVRGFTMEKIAIIGPSGSGKTTLTKDLSSTLKIQAFHLDRLFWQGDWIKVTRDNRVDILQHLVQEKQWIIEGNYINSTELHLIAADTIIFLDITPLVCLLRLIKRYRKYHGRPRRDIPEGCTEKLTMYRILKVLSFPLRERKTLTQKLSDFETKEIFWLRSKREIEDFFAQPEQYIHEKRQFAKTLSVLERSFNIISSFFF
jgi:adenylate kinase family enzyme